LLCFRNVLQCMFSFDAQKYSIITVFSHRAEF
jgi:hypothetical protein